MVFAMPTPQDTPPLSTTAASKVVNLDEAPAHRTATVTLCIFYAVLLALVQGYRIGRTAGRKTRTRVSNALVYVQGVICTAFLLATAVLVAGLGLQTDAQCYVAIRICIGMYGSAKIALTLFLLERVHIVRAPFVKRVRDPIWVVGATITICGYVGIMAGQYINPRADLSRVDGICRIGIHPDAAIAVTVFDTVLNAILTGIFLWQVRPALKSLAHRFPHHGEPSNEEGRKRRSWNSSQQGGLVARTPRNSSAQKNVRNMLVRNVIGSILLLVNIIVNNAVFIRYNFAKMGHACLLMCLTDVVLGMLITHWLTMRAAEDMTDPQRYNSTTSDISTPTTVRSRRATLDLSTIRADAFQKIGAKAAPVSNGFLLGSKDTIHSSLR